MKVFACRSYFSSFLFLIQPYISQFNGRINKLPYFFQLLLARILFDISDCFFYWFWEFVYALHPKQLLKNKVFTYLFFFLKKQISNNFIKKWGIEPLLTSHSRRQPRLRFFNPQHDRVPPWITARRHHHFTTHNLFLITNKMIKKNSCFTSHLK